MFSHFGYEYVIAINGQKLLDLAILNGRSQEAR
jgi:hypothetical protein